MAISRNDAKNFIFNILAADLGLPPSQFQEGDDLEGDYLYDSGARVNLGKKINNQHWHNVRVTPMEMDAVSTIKSLVDLIFAKARTSAPEPADSTVAAAGRPAAQTKAGRKGKPG